MIEYTCWTFKLVQQANNCCADLSLYRGVIRGVRLWHQHVGGIYELVTVDSKEKWREKETERQRNNETERHTKRDRKTETENNRDVGKENKRPWTDTEVL